jgi:predicted enzyme related to lactoylglutathione lyase
METNGIGWFEIPVLDMERAKAFYETSLEIIITVRDFGGSQMRWFPNVHGKPGASGLLMKHKAYIPSVTHGAFLYFSPTYITSVLQKVEKAGVSIIQPKTEIARGQGFMALIKDTEGNRIGLRSFD